MRKEKFGTGGTRTHALIVGISLKSKRATNCAMTNPRKPNWDIFISCHGRHGTTVFSSCKCWQNNLLLIGHGLNTYWFRQCRFLKTLTIFCANFQKFKSMKNISLKRCKSRQNGFGQLKSSSKRSKWKKFSAGTLVGAPVETVVRRSLRGHWVAPRSQQLPLLLWHTVLKTGILFGLLVNHFGHNQWILTIFWIALTI